MNRALRTLPPLSLPNDLLSLKGEKFFEFIHQSCVGALMEFMQILAVDTVHKLLAMQHDILSIFQKKYRELKKVTEQACLHLDDGSLLLKPGLRLDFDRLITCLQAATKEKQMKDKETHSIENILSSLRKFIELHEPNEDISTHNLVFLGSFVDNVLKNVSRNKNNYRFNDQVIKFATALNILGGRNAYEFVRLNLPGSLPSLSTLNDILEKSTIKIEEGQFQYEELRRQADTFGYQIAMCSEDSTSVIEKVSYDVYTNHFTGFATPLDEGIPSPCYFKTASFDRFKRWFDEKEKAKHLTVHMIQPVTSSSSHLSPFLLAAYGNSNTYKATDVLQRWLWIYNKSLESGVRVITFSTDCDPRYLLAMRLATGFFAKLDTPLMSNRNDLFDIHLPKEWSSWFFMKSNQLFLCFQDPIHLCTKIRNRLLSSTATMLIGREVVSVQLLMNLINIKSKLMHGLVKTDIEPKDRQNYNSCWKISREEVIVALQDIDESGATAVYLRLLRSVILAYVENNTSIRDRIYHSWLAVFLCRIWQTWLYNIDEEDLGEVHVRKKKEDLFITSPAHFSIELNAHVLLFITLLVCQQKLPSSVLTMTKHGSQPCEALFRLSRSMSGAFSSVVNFTVKQFLKRAKKLSVLNELENQSEFNPSESILRFPKHHKRRRKNSVDIVSTLNTDINDLTTKNVEMIICRAFDDAYELLSDLGIDDDLKKIKMNTMSRVNTYVKNQFNKRFRTISPNSSQTYSSDEESNDDGESDSDYTSYSIPDGSSDDELDESFSSTNSQSYPKGMRLFQSINQSLINSYFCVDIDTVKGYMHKETACWFLTEEKFNLSADRLKRVQQSNR